MAAELAKKNADLAAEVEVVALCALAPTNLTRPAECTIILLFSKSP